jgi:response regulator RpfG family c-di-GMP phosphodiesterase
LSHSRRILYVDDEAINLKLFHLSFNKDYEILTALSGELGLEILNQNPDIQLIITDLRMPEMDGLQFIKEIKRKNPLSICMILTGFLDSDAMLEGFNKELLFRYITKPWKKDEISPLIEEAFQRLKS